VWDSRGRLSHKRKIAQVIFSRSLTETTGHAAIAL
jgi:hypothetical protein